MSGFAQGARTDLAYVVETSFGVTPGGPTMLSIPYKTHSLSLTKQRVQGNDIQSDRMPRVDRHGTRQAGGTIEVDLRADDFDDFIESAFFSAFDTDGIITIGTTPKFMTIEDSANDIVQYRQFSGMGVSQMSVSIAPNQMVQTVFTMMGQDLTQAQTQLGAPTAASGAEPFDSFNGEVLENGSPITNVSSIDFTVSNSFAPAFVVGSKTAPCLEFGRAVVEGTVTVYYENNTLIDKFLDETETSIQVEVDDTTTGGSYRFILPRLKYNGADVPVANPQSRFITIPFVGLYDSTSGTNLQITKGG